LRPGTKLPDSVGGTGQGLDASIPASSRSNSSIVVIGGRHSSPLQT